MEGVNTPSLPQICGRFVMFNSKKRASMVAQIVKNPTGSGGDSGLIPGSGRSPGEGHGNPLQYPCLENAVDGGAWRATVHGVSNSLTQLSDFTVTFIVRNKDHQTVIQREVEFIYLPGEGERDHLDEGYAGLPEQK